MSFRSALLALTVIAAPAAALAQPVTGPYISIGAGINYLQNQTVSDSTGNISGTVGAKTDLKYDGIGPLGVGAVGWGFGNGFRVELEGQYRENQIKDLGGQALSGDTVQYGGFVNGYYDFDMSGSDLSAITPYIGVGAGYLVNKFNNVSFSGVDANGDSTFFRSTGEKGDYALQGILGLSYAIASVPGLSLTAEYRFTTTPSDLDHNGQFLTASASLPGNTKVDGAYNHAGVIGLRYALWQPEPAAPVVAPPPPAAEPVVQPARTYLVFFDWDRADLSPRAREIVAQAAQASTKVQVTKIEVNGYTDLSGTAAYNQKLSVRRAKAVEAELVKDGVAQSAIEIHGYGESNPLVPTAKGVREPQNRRVEIILK